MSVPHGHWKTTTFVGALTLRGFIAPFVLDGAINRDDFETYVAQVLVPELRPGDIVVMDNLSSHKGPKVGDLIEAAGAKLLYLPSLQPGLQPVTLRRGPRVVSLLFLAGRDGGAERGLFAQAAASRLAVAGGIGCQFHGSRSPRRLAG